MKKRVDYYSMEAYEEDNAPSAGCVTVVHDNGWLLCDLTTCCKRPQTAVKRLFDQLHEPILADWYEYMNEAVCCGIMNDTDVYGIGRSRNPHCIFSWAVEEVDDGIWYVFLNVRKDRIIWGNEMISGAELVKRLMDENGDLDKRLSALMPDQDALELAKNSFCGDYTPARLIDRYIEYTGFQTVLAKG